MKYDDAQSSQSSSALEALLPELKKIHVDGNEPLYQTPTENHNTYCYWDDGETQLENPAYDNTVTPTAKNEPFCFKRHTSGAKIKGEFATSSALSISRNVVWEAGGEESWDGGPVWTSGSTFDTGWMSIDGYIINQVKRYNSSFTITDWQYTIASGTNSPVPVSGSTNHTVFVILGPNGYGVAATEATVKRMDYICNKCNGKTSLDDCASALAQAIGNGSKMGTPSATRWRALHNDASFARLECYAGRELAVEALRLLGVDDSKVEPKPGDQDDEECKSFASSDPTGDPDYPSDVTDYEVDGESHNLEWSIETDWDPHYPFEASFRIDDAGTWKYYTVKDPSGPFTGSGSTVLEKHKSALYKVLDYIRDGSEYFGQRYWPFESGNVEFPNDE